MWHEFLYAAGISVAAMFPIVFCSFFEQNFTYVTSPFRGSGQAGAGVKFFTISLDYTNQLVQ